MKEQFLTIQWKRFLLAAAVGLALVLEATSVVDRWRTQDDPCVQFHPNGSECQENK
jgi:hypothetical protein